ncbi:hypothetical protein [Nocardioides sp. Root190]|uniref:hypothetical protein n=1 Tax=Nocardioides sp. Root190 TaxID=1736488 RepID=UPI0012FC64E2|nr:hypothetical protein [Nocardioides sp. Root190]
MKLALASPADILELASEFDGRRTFYATAAVRIDDGRLREVREAVVEHARTCGFPETSARPTFDAGLPLLLREQLEIAPAEAGVAEVWNYLSLILLPDVALWRWPNPHADPGYERLIGRPRNVFRRHWWRAHLLGPALTARLGEDEIVQIVERTATLGGNPRVARAVAHSFVSSVDEARIEIDGALLAVRRMEVMRALAKRVLRVARVVALATLDDDDLSRLMSDLMSDTLAREAELLAGRVAFLEDDHDG